MGGLKKAVAPSAFPVLRSLVLPVTDVSRERTDKEWGELFEAVLLSVLEI